jgi:hypothetical protein
MTICCIVYLDHQSMNTEQVCNFLAIPRIGESVTLSDDTTHTVKEVIHRAGVARRRPSISVILTKGRR